jgi:hypothetical protein
MAIDTVLACQVKIPFLLLVVFQNIHGVGGIPVAIHTFCNEGGHRVFFGPVGIVTGCTGHVGLLKTTACPKKLPLFAMDVGFAIVGAEIGKIKMGQSVAGDKAKKGALRRLIVPGMTGCANIELLLTA